MGEGLSSAKDGSSADGYLARAAAKDAAGVVVIQEWWGLNDHIKTVADRLACEGFHALAPDLYHGQQTKSPDEAGKLMMALDIARAERDLRGSVAQLKSLTGRAVGTIGFCMGGTLSLFAACANGDAVGACVVYYGGHMAVANDFDRLEAPVLGHWAEHDDWANQNAKTIARELDARKKPYEFHRYPGTKHAFFNDERAEVYDRAAAELSFARTLAFLRKQL